MVYLELDEIEDAYKEAQTKALLWYEPFNEYERIASNKLRADHNPLMPKVNDGSLAASMVETPMLVLPNMQTGKIECTDNDKPWLNELVNIVLNKKIIPYANTMAGWFDKEQTALYRALKYGAQPRYNFYVSSDKYTGSDWSLPYIKNLKLEPGKYSVDDCDFVFLDIFYTKLQLKKLIATIEEDNKKLKKEGEKADTSWDLKELKKLVDKAVSDKDMHEMTLAEREKAVSASGIKLTACFQRGKGAPFYMFSCAGEYSVVRTWDNPDPTGDLPITMQYCFMDLENPYGRGRVEMAGPTQNVLDYLTQAHVFATQVGLQPPVQAKGPIDGANLNSWVHAPNAIWRTGQAQVEVMQNTNSVYTQFPTNYGMYQAQLQNLQGKTTGSVSSESGNPGFSKTQAGVKKQDQRDNAQELYLRNKADQASAQMITKMVNVHMAQMKGADFMKLTADEAERLMKAGLIDEDPTTKLPSKDEIDFMYDDLRGTYTFTYDPRPESDEDEKSRWLELIGIATSNPNILPAVEQSGFRFNLGEAFKRVISNSGTKDADKVLVPIDPEEQLIADQAQDVMNPNEPAMDMPTEQQLMPQQSGEPAPEEIQALAQQLMQQSGLDEQTAMFVAHASLAGVPEEQILAKLGAR